MFAFFSLSRIGTIARKSGEGAIPPFSTSRRIGSSYRGGLINVPRARDLLVVRPVGPCYLTLACESLIELDRDTLHTRLGSSHECHSGDGRCAFALVSFVQVGLALHGPLSVESLRCRLLPPLRLIVARASRVRALPDEPELVEYQLQVVVVFEFLYILSLLFLARRAFVYRCCTAIASYAGKISLYTADLSACPGNVISGA
uniref:Uncharacterized protein n=1 Tax=Ananas comosus var. bracteatus TaxID=296719 RepID=A0A6V7PRW4_ANACO|nr:unnamed protein product [Ananas comosus var. bracteatus]